MVMRLVRVHTKDYWVLVLVKDFGHRREFLDIARIGWN